jgi:hypothetical protein
MSEKEQPLQVSKPSKKMDSQDHERRSEENPSVENSSEEKLSETVKTSIEYSEEPVPHLHAKTYLTIFAVCLIYFAQVINVVGAGAVSAIHLLWKKFKANSNSALKIFQLSSVTRSRASG